MFVSYFSYPQIRDTYMKSSNNLLAIQGRPCMRAHFRIHNRCSIYALLLLEFHKTVRSLEKYPGIWGILKNKENVTDESQHPWEALPFQHCSWCCKMALGVQSDMKHSRYPCLVWHLERGLTSRSVPPSLYRVDPRSSSTKSKNERRS